MTFTLSRNRDAWFVIRGYKYQIDLTIRRWLSITESQVLLLESGEDIDLVNDAVLKGPDGLDRELEQVKHLDSPITLRSAACRIAMANAAQHFAANPTKELLFRFCTNSSTTTERPSAFDDRRSAIEIWESLRKGDIDESTRPPRLIALLAFLRSLTKPTKGVDDGTWNAFTAYLHAVSFNDLARFISRFEWSTQQPGTEEASKDIIRRLLWGTAVGKPDLSALDKVSFVFGAWLYGENSQQPHGYELERVWLEASRRGWKIEVSGADGPLLLFAAGERPVSTNGQDDRHQQFVRGHRPGRQAERIWTNGFGPAPSSISYRQAVPENLSLFLGGATRYDGLEIVVRATQPQTDQLEIVLVERDSAAWGTVVPISHQWQPIVVPLDRLKFFGHWAHPQGRGGDQDRLRLDNLSAVNFCFGAWLYGDRARLPHGVEIESASLVEMR